MTLSKGTRGADTKADTKFATPNTPRTPMSTFEAEGMAIQFRAKTLAEWEEMRRKDPVTLPQIFSADSNFRNRLRGWWLFQLRSIKAE